MLFFSLITLLKLQRKYILFIQLHDKKYIFFMIYKKDLLTDAIWYEFEWITSANLNLDNY